MSKYTRATARCPKCPAEGQVLDTRLEQGRRRRRRECVSCGFRWTTWEMSERDRRLVDRVSALTDQLLEIMDEEQENG